MSLHNHQQSPIAPLRPELNEQINLVATKCVECQSCVSECDFLSEYGDPKKLADGYSLTDGSFELPFKCSLCALCNAVCCEDVNPTAMFLEMRRAAVARGEADLAKQRGLLNYERRGTSKRFSWYALPDNCDTIFFPGCGLSGSRSDTTLQVFEQLQKIIPNVGIVLDCCTKPSHDLGDDEHFNAMFNEMKDYLLRSGIKTILLACPNCHKVFSDYSAEFQVRTVYEDLAKIDFCPTQKTKTPVAVHDPCTARFNVPAQVAVRELLHGQGIQIAELPHSRKNTICCGEGGAVSFLQPELASNWGKKRVAEANGQPLISYCSGCTETLGAQTEARHILDLLFSDNPKTAKSPLTYFKRLKLKKHLQDNFPAALTRERTFQGGSSLRHKGSLKLYRHLVTGTLLLLLSLGFSRLLFLPF